MVKGLLKFAALTLIMGVGACTQVVNPPKISDTGAVEHPTGFAPALVSRYYRITQHDNEDGSITQRPNYSGIVYHPRQATHAGFEGWDVLELPRDSSNVSDWLHLELNRDAALAVLWEDSAGWLSGWTREDATIDGMNVYTRAFGRGGVTLGSPGEGKKAYTVLIAEGGGVPSPAPRLPDGQSVVPEPNRACPDWVDNLFLATGPDGKLYESWHPQIDPVYWCYFEHEHGTDPSLVDYAPAFRYVADKNYGQAEQHEGFKGFGMRDVESDDGRRYHWYVNIHATSSSIARTCARQHTVVIAVVDAANGELVAELGYKGEYGAVASNQGEHPLIQPTFKTTCADQAAIADATDAIKRVRVANESGVSNSGYETWRGGLNRTVGLDFRGSTGMTIDIRDPMTSCDTFACRGAISTGSNGTRRTLRFSELRLQHANEFVQIFDAADGEVDGVFYTDPYGKLLRNAADADAIRQYIKPGLDVKIDGHFATEDAWRALYTRDTHPEELTLEGGIGNTN